MRDWSNRSIYYTDFAKQGEEEVRRQFTSGILDGEARPYAADWLREFDDAREVARRTTLDEAALSASKAAASQASEAAVANELARNANQLARKAQIWAIMANMIAVAAIAFSIYTFFHQKA